jgi:hypothetical protein
MSSSASPSPSRMIVPLPNCFSIWASAAWRALAFSLPATEMLVPLTSASMWNLLEYQWVVLDSSNLLLTTGWMLEQ